MTPATLHPHDVVVLSEGHCGLPQGAEGTIVDANESGLIVEFINSDGSTHCLADVPRSAVRRAAESPGWRWRDVDTPF